MSHSGMGFKEIQHTADCAISIWAPDLRSLFGEAALGLNHIAGARLAPLGRTTRRLALRAADEEGLLVAFLTELINFQELERLAFDRFELELEPGMLEATLWGALLISHDRLVKAVTFHKLEIRSDGATLRAEIVFDV